VPEFEIKQAGMGGQMRVFLKQKHRIKLLLIRVSKIVIARPALKTGCKKIFSLFPGFYRRLCRIVREDKIRSQLQVGLDFSSVSEDEIVHGMPEPVYRSYLFLKNTERKSHESCD